MRAIAMTTLSLLLSPAIGTRGVPSTASAQGTATSAMPGSQSSFVNQESTAGESIDHDLSVEIIRMAYGLLETYAAGPTTSLSFSLSDFETVPRERFDEIPYRELATFPEGRVIDVGRSQSKPAGSEVSHVQFIARWRTHEHSIADLPEGPKMLTWTVAEVLDEVAATAPEIGGDPSLADAYTFTRYHVAVNMNGEEREYVAAFLWLESSDAESRNLRVFDHITQGVALAAVEDLPTLAEAHVLRQSEAQRLRVGETGRTSDSRSDRLPAPVEAGTNRTSPNQDPCPIDCCDESSCTPIVIDLLGDGFRFSSGTGGVDFDILREGYPIRVSWTEVGTDDVFLVRDLGSDGLIAHSGELFGDRTAQPKTDELNSYNALSQYDTEPFRGNGDGKIDAEDVIYDNLWVWHDRNHDGFSSWDELYTLDQAGIEAIYLDYWRSKERDRHGNELRYFGRVCLSARDGTLENQLVSQGSLSETDQVEGYVLDPMKLRVNEDPGALAGTECEGRIVQSTDVFFIDGY